MELHQNRAMELCNTNQAVLLISSSTLGQGTARANYSLRDWCPSDKGDLETDQDTSCMMVPMIHHPKHNSDITASICSFWIVTNVVFCLLSLPAKSWLR